MDSWTMTQTVLRSSKSFKENLLSKYTFLSPPQLLYTYNTPIRRSAAQVVGSLQAENMTNVLSEVLARLEALEQK
ncbi:hypothetical protein L218DRAFT_840492, partial [Marasmius fiardii PR-910]